MKTLIFAHPHTTSFSLSDADLFWTQNPQKVLQWKKENTHGILVLDLDAYDKCFWSIDQAYVYIGFSRDFETLTAAKRAGFHFTVSTQIEFAKAISNAFQNKINTFT